MRILAAMLFCATLATCETGKGKYLAFGIVATPLCAMAPP